MNYAFKDEDYTHTVDFTVGGNFIYPDYGIYSYKVRDINGTIILSEDNVSLPGKAEEATDGDVIPVDRAIITVPAEYNILSESELFNSRVIEVNFLYEGKAYTIRSSYRIINYCFFTASTKDVRDYYGFNEGELPDEDIDLTEVYLELVQKFGDTFVGCLKSTGVGNFRANRLMVLKGVVKVFPSVKLRVNQEENDGSSKFLRYLNKIDWDKFLQKALDEIEDLENNLTGEDTINYADYTPLYLGSVVDAITGEE